MSQLVCLPPPTPCRLTLNNPLLVYNILYAVILPLVLILAWALVAQPPFHKAHVTVLGLAISAVMTCFITDVIKNSVGRPRPDLLARCKAKEGTPEHQLVTIEVCTETDHHVLHDGWRSFPSGHSSLAFSGLGFLALYAPDSTFILLCTTDNKSRFFAGQLHVFRPRSDLSHVLLALAPLIGAALIAISRLEDYRHDVYDVTVGSILGIVVAYFSYSRYYPPLHSSNCETPYPSRAEEATVTMKLKDEEARIESRKAWSTDTADEEAERVPLRDTGRASRSASYNG